jgi:hypothetical protein
MSKFCEAFRVGENVQLADVATLEDLQTKFADRIIIVPNMAQYAGRRVQIRCANATDGYQFVEITGRWMEDAIVDPCLQSEIQPTDPFSFAPASETYVASPDSHHRPGFVSVHDLSGNLYLRFRSFHPACDALTLNRIAKIRCKLSFEINLGFFPKCGESSE